jgi:predicted phage-related endonuclease
VNSDRLAWLRERKTCIGGSDAAAILGYSTYRTALDVYHDKTTEDVSDHDNKVLRFGRNVEGAIADMYQYETGRPVIDAGGTVIRRHPEYSFIGTTMDRYTAEQDGDPTVPLELKHISRYDCTPDEWRIEPLIDQQIQLQMQEFCAEATWGALAGMFPGYHLEHIDIEINHRFLDSAIPKLEKFWQRVVNREPPPVQSERDLKAIKQVWAKETPSLISLPSDTSGIVDAWLKHKAEANESERLADHCQAKLIERMKDATAGQIPGGGFLTLKTTKKKGHVVPPSEFRQLRYKKGF